MRQLLGETTMDSDGPKAGAWRTQHITLSRIANQIACACAWLVNFQVILIPLKPIEKVDEVEEYLDVYFDTESDDDADTEPSDDEIEYVCKNDMIMRVV